MEQESNYVLHRDTILDGRYRIERVIGEGGFGITYEAVNEKLDMTVAIKEFFWRGYIYRDVEKSNQVTYTDTVAEDFVRAKNRFMQEARILAGFNDENAIVKVLDYFEENDTVYIVMNYLHGISLDEYLKENGVMTWKEVLDRFRPLMETLERVHNRGVIHRDISPSNIMVLEDGSLCLIDFGAAKEDFMLNDDKTTTVFSKKGYTPIEQYAQKGKLGAWTDVYSLSAVLYMCLTGTTPPDSVQRAVYDEYETLSDRKIDAPADMDALLKKGLEVHSDKRYSNMRELLKAIDNLTAEKKSRKKRKIVIVSAAFFVVLIVCACVAYKYREQIYFGFEETETFYMMLDEDNTVDVINGDFEKIEERIKILVGDKPYIWEKEKDCFKGVIPLSCFGNEYTRGIIMNLLIRPCEWNICDVTLDSEYIEYIGCKDKDYNTFVIELSGDTPQDTLDTLEDLCEDKATLSVDYGCYNHLSINGKLSSRYQYTWDLSKEWKNKRARELFVHNISNDALSISYKGVYSQIQTKWDNIETDKFGKNQCEPDKLSDNTVTLEYGCSYDDDITDGEIIDSVKELKKRLDLLEIPYAMGTELKNDRHFVLRVNQKDYNEDLFWFLFLNKSDINIQDGMGRIIAYGKDVNKFDIDTDMLDGCVRLSINKDFLYDEENAKRCIEDMEEKKINAYYLAAKEIPVLRGEWSGETSYIEEYKSRQFTFSSTLLNNKKLQDNNRLLSILKRIIVDDASMITNYELLCYHYSDNQNVVAKEAKEKNDNFSFITSYDEEIISNIESLSDKYPVDGFVDYDIGEKKVRVFLSYKTYFDNFKDINKAIEQIYHIKQNCDIENGSSWDSLTIGIANRYDEESYAARIIFSINDKCYDNEKTFVANIIAYEKDEAKWADEICEAMKNDARFADYELDYMNYSGYYIY